MCRDNQPVADGTGKRGEKRSREEGVKACVEGEGNVDIPRYVVAAFGCSSWRSTNARDLCSARNRRDAGNNGITGNNQMKGFA